MRDMDFIMSLFIIGYLVRVITLKADYIKSYALC